MQTKFQEFDADQRIELEAGLAEHLDVDVYARKELMAIQMRQIRLGLMEGLDVSQYASAEYDWFQMEEIRKGMEKGVDYTRYASPDIPYMKMREIRKGLKQGIDLTGFIKLSHGILHVLRKAIQSKVKIVDYITAGYDVEQLEEIRLALVDKLPIAPYLSKELLGASIREIANGLRAGLDPSEYATMEYGWQQMREIRLGLEHRVDVQRYSNSLFSWQQMHEIRLGLEAGIDVTPYCRFLYTAGDMEKLRRQISVEEVLDEIAQREHTVADHQQIACWISNDEMEACIEIHCTEATVVTRRAIMDTLREEGVVRGICKEEIDDLLANKRYNQTIIVAKGQPARRGQDGWYEYFFETKPDHAPKVQPDGSVDYRHVHRYETVKREQKIAYYHAAGAGENGYTVTGKLLFAKRGKEKNLLLGRGFQLMPDQKTYIAAIDGRIELLDNGRIEITRLCVLDEVTLATGNVEFDGSILIRGDVGSGVQISATEDITIDGTVEAAVIRCGGEIFLRKGVNGAGIGMIQAGGKIIGNFFEAVTVYAGDDMQANYCLNSNLYSEGMITINGRRGKIVGGTVSAVKGIRVHNAGNRAGVHTVLRMGIDDAFLQKKRHVEQKIDNIQKDLSILQNAYADFLQKYPAEVRNIMDMFLKIENAIYTEELQLDELYKKRWELEEKMKAMVGAKAVISGSLYEGTYIVIDNVGWQAFTTQDVTVERVKEQLVAYKNGR